MKQLFNGREKLNMAAGFSLVEVLVALTIIMVGIFGAYELVNQSLAMANNASMRLTAAYLAKEGIEIARNIRDTNYLKIYHDNGTGGYRWDDGLTQDGSLMSCLDGCGADYMMHELDADLANRPLRFDDSGLFSYSSANDSRYTRIIAVEKQGVAPDEYLEIGVRIEWIAHGVSQSLTVRENIYNWWQM